MLESLCNSLSCEHFIFLICRFDDLFPHLELVELVEMGAIGISKDQSDQRFLCRLSSLLNLSYVFFISYHTILPPRRTVFFSFLFRLSPFLPLLPLLPPSLDHVLYQTTGPTAAISNMISFVYKSIE